MLTPAYILVGHYLKLFEVHFPQMLKDTMSLVKQMENIVLLVTALCLITARLGWSE